MLLTPAILEEMLDHTDFFHRRKVSVIGQTFNTYPKDNLLFIDSDAFFITNPSVMMNDFVPGESFMHKCEYDLEEGLATFASYGQPEFPTAFIQYITGRDFIIGGTVEHFSQKDFSWNSGVLGITRDFAAYMPDVFKLTDAFYANSKWFISEQMAFALILQRRTKIKPAEQYVLHYWGKRQKVLLDRLINGLLNSHSPAALANADFIRTISREWKKEVEANMILDQAVTALSHGSWFFGFKKCIQLLLKAPAHLGLLYKELGAAKKQA